MAPVALTVLFLLLSLLPSCKTIPVAGECADTVSTRCMTERKCSLDEKRGCMVCQCADPGVPQFPFGNDNRLPAPAGPGIP